MLLPWSERALHRYVTSDEMPLGTWMRGGRRRAVVAACLWAVVEVIGMANLAAQETLRGSLSQQLVSQFQPDRSSAFLTPSSQLMQQFQRSLQPALLNVGPFRGELAAGLGVTYDDNANLTNVDRQSEVRFDQSLGLSLNWPVSYLNQIGLQLGVTLTEVATSGKANTQQTGITNNTQQTGITNNTQAFDISIQPGTNVSFQFLAGDVLVGVHDYLSVLQDPTQDPGVANQSVLGRVTNDAGVSALWNVGRLLLGGSFDYSYSSDQSSNLAGGDRNTFRPAVSAAFTLSPQVSTGLDAVYINSTSSGSGALNAISVGPFFRGQLTRAIAVDVQGGLYYINASNTSVNGINTSGIPSTDYYLSFAVSHQLTRDIQYLVSFSRDIDFSTGNDLTETNSFTLGAGWNLGRDFGLSVGGLANFGKVVSGEFPGSFTQYGAHVQLGWSPSRRIRTAISYEFLVRSGPGSTGNITGVGASYKQNRIDLTVSYSF
jgi:hypothetical protein